MNHFTSIRIEGAIFSSDILEKLDELKGQKPADFGFDKPVKDEIARAWAVAQDYWRIFQRRSEALSENSHGTTETRNAWMVPLLSLLGYKPEVQQKGAEVMGRNFAISHRDLSRDGFPIHIMGCRDSLDQKRADSGPRMSPHGLVQEYINLTEHLYAIVTNGLQLRLLRDSSRLVKLSYIEFDLERMFTDGIFSDFALLYRLLHATRMPVNQESITEALIEGYHQDSLDSGSRIRDGLSEAVRDTIEKLGSGFLRHPENEALRQAVADGSLAPREFYHCNLRLVYRVLFLMVAEDRNLLFPPGASRGKQKIYYDYYSLSRLRRLAEKSYLSDVKDQDYWINLRQVFQLFENEELAGRMDLVPLGGMLFNEQSLGLLAASSLDNRSLADALRSFTWFRDSQTGQTIRINYAALNVEELGSVYEFLLEMSPDLQLAQKTFSLISAAGNERKTTGSYYTPECLVSQLLKTALDPVIDQRTKEAAKKTTNGDRKPAMEEALLKIKVCDPACGSGHFLIGAANHLARRLCEIRFDGEEPSPQAYRHALREVITHCIYGVDINPMSVELCKVSLWMEAMEPGKPLGFLDHHIKCGNSLLGTTPALLSRGIPDDAFNSIEGDDKTICTALKKRNKEEREKKLDDLFANTEAKWSYQHAFEDAIHEVEGMDDGNIQSLEKKQLAYEEFLHSTSYTGGKRLHDAWCAAFVCPKVEGAQTITQQLIREMQIDPNRCPKEQRALIDGLSTQYNFFHWHLEFPDVFQSLENIDEKDSKGWKGGFDCMLGNPPWDRIALEELEYFSAREPSILEAPTTAARKTAISNLKQHNPNLYLEYKIAKRHSDASGSYFSNCGIYPLGASGRLNTYPLFTELGLFLLNPLGRVGLIVQTGIATDAPMADFWGYLIKERRLVLLLDFENRKPIFPHVHRELKFCLVTLTAKPQSEEAVVNVGYWLINPEEISDPDKVYSLPVASLEVVSPNTKQPILSRSSRDGLLVTQIYTKCDVMWNNELKAGIAKAFVAMTSASYSQHFLREVDLPANRGEFNQSWRTSAAQEEYLPLIEAKQIYQYDPMYATYEGVSAEDISSGNPLLMSSGFSLPKPRFWAASQIVKNFWSSKKMLGGWALAYRDVTNVNNERTTIAVILPTIGFLQPLNGIKCSTVAHASIVIAAANSFCCDYVARLRFSGRHLNVTTFNQLPVPKNANVQFIIPRVLELSLIADCLASFGISLGYSGPFFLCNENRRFEIRCELDAAFFHLYGIDNEDDVDYIMETFPLVKRKDEKQYGIYRTKERILEIYRDMARCTAEGQEYQSALNPPPGPPADAEGTFIPAEQWHTLDPARISHIHPPKEAAISVPRKMAAPKPPEQTVKVAYPRNEADKVLCSVALQIVKRTGGVEAIDLTHVLLFTVHPQRASRLIGRSEKELDADKIAAAADVELHVQQMRAFLETSGAISVESSRARRVIPGPSIDDTLISLKTNIGHWPDHAMKAVADYKAIAGGTVSPTREQEAVISTEENDIAGIAELWSA